MRDHYDRGPSRRDDRRGDRRPSYNRDDRDSDRGQREMFDAVCDECGRDCKVPFRPTSNKPIFCSDCFEKMQGGNQRRDGSFGDMNLQRQLDEINYKLGKILKMLEPKAPPVYNKLPPVKKRAEKVFEEIVAKVEDIQEPEKTEEAA